ncbi:MAG: hypothetical protein LC775_19805, partial [Acidobacteria bacterium]|nr:hypothetical protein [Acidobacteriota bacterium]
MSADDTVAQPKAQAQRREAARVTGKVGVLHSSVDLWESKTHGEPREGTYPNAERRSEGCGDGPRELTTPDNVRKLQITLYRKAKAEPEYRFWSIKLAPKAMRTKWDSERENRTHGLMRGGEQTVISHLASQSVASRLLYWRFAHA